MKDYLGNTALYYAVQNMHIETLRILIEFGASVHARCELGNTALHQAFMIGDKVPKNLNIISCLLAAGANPEMKNNYG
jgi:ankyrin repeat protein